MLSKSATIFISAILIFAGSISWIFVFAIADKAANTDTAHVLREISFFVGLGLYTLGIYIATNYNPPIREGLNTLTMNEVYEIVSAPNEKEINSSFFAITLRQRGNQLIIHKLAEIPPKIFKVVPDHVGKPSIRDLTGMEKLSAG